MGGWCLSMKHTQRRCLWMQPSWRVSVKTEGQGSLVSLTTRGHVGDFTVDRRPRWLQRMSRERTNCKLRQSSIGFPWNGFTKAATPSLSLAKSLCKQFNFTFRPVSGFIFPLKSAAWTRQIDREVPPSTSWTVFLYPHYIAAIVWFILFSDTSDRRIAFICHDVVLIDYQYFLSHVSIACP